MLMNHFICEGKLLEDFKTTMSSSKSFEETYESIKKSSSPSSPMSAPPCRGRKDPAGTRKIVQPTAQDDDDEEEEEEEEMEFSMGKLIRQASLNTIHAAKGVTAISEKKPERKTSLMESQELQGFKNLGFDSSETKAGGVISTIPRREGDGAEKNRLRRTQSWAPPVPGGGKRSTEEDIKAQIKFWARAVASNVRPD